MKFGSFDSLEKSCRPAAILTQIVRNIQALITYRVSLVKEDELVNDDLIIENSVKVRGFETRIRIMLNFAADALSLKVLYENNCMLKQYGN